MLLKKFFTQSLIISYAVSIKGGWIYGNPSIFFLFDKNIVILKPKFNFKITIFYGSQLDLQQTLIKRIDSSVHIVRQTIDFSEMTHAFYFIVRIKVFDTSIEHSIYQFNFAD